jgi:hypothetical protein
MGRGWLATRYCWRQRGAPRIGGPVLEADTSGPVNLTAGAG